MKITFHFEHSSLSDWSDDHEMEVVLNVLAVDEGDTPWGISCFVSQHRYSIPKTEFSSPYNLDFDIGKIESISEKEMVIGVSAAIEVEGGDEIFWIDKFFVSEIEKIPEGLQLFEGDNSEP